MKQITSFRTLTTLTAKDSAAGFPVANVALLDPGLIWKPATTGETWILVDFGSATTVAGVFLNRANFLSATIQGNDTDSWAGPSFSQAKTLVTDDIGNTHGYWTLTAFNYRYLRILIPAQSFLDGATVPSLGNLIAAAAEVSVRVASFGPAQMTEYTVFRADGGSLSKTRKGQRRHVWRVSVNGTKAEIDTLKACPTSDVAVWFEDLGSAGGSWLVYWPETIQEQVAGSLDDKADFQLEEKV
jgi:hypothetical protein